MIYRHVLLQFKKQFKKPILTQTDEKKLYNLYIGKDVLKNEDEESSKRKINSYLNKITIKSYDNITKDIIRLIKQFNLFDFTIQNIYNKINILNTFTHILTKFYIKIINEFNQTKLIKIKINEILMNKPLIKDVDYESFCSQQKQKKTMINNFNFIFYLYKYDEIDSLDNLINFLINNIKNNESLIYAEGLKHIVTLLKEYDMTMPLINININDFSGKIKFTLMDINDKISS